MSYTYHLLTEAEPFSEHFGGAISRWAANVLRSEEDSCVIAPSADATWNFSPERVRIATGLARYKRITDAGGHHLPWMIRLKMIRHAIEPQLDDLRPGHTVWVHNRPEMAAALARSVHRRGARLVLHMHNSHLVQWSRSIAERSGADTYVFVSEFLLQEAVSKFPHLRSTAVLPNGANRDLFTPSAQLPLNDPPTVLFASRLVPEKGLHIFMEAMRLLLQEGIAAQGIVVGATGFGNSQESQYVREMRQGAPVNVRFEPYCSGKTLAEMFRQADLFCLPSCWDDPAPLAVLEALASGVPVVASQSGGIPEQLKFGGGVTVARNNAVQLAHALQRLIVDPARRAKLRQEALEASTQHFTWAAVRRNYRRILDGSPELHNRFEVLTGNYA